MTTWAIILSLWIAPALVLLVALVRANLRKAARRRADDEKAVGPPSPRSAKSAPAE